MLNAYPLYGHSIYWYCLKAWMTNLNIYFIHTKFWYLCLQIISKCTICYCLHSFVLFTFWWTIFDLGLHPKIDIVRQGRSRDQDGEVRNTVQLDLEIYYREHRRWWCVGDITSLTHAATCARLTISRCVLQDNVETRRKTDAVPVCGDQHCCYEDSDSLPGHSSLTLSMWALVISRSLIRQSPELLNDRTLNFHRQQNLTARRSRLTNC